MSLWIFCSRTSAGWSYVDRLTGVHTVLSSYLPSGGSPAKYSAYLIHRNALVLAPKRELLVETEKKPRDPRSRLRARIPLETQSSTPKPWSKSRQRSQRDMVVAKLSSLPGHLPVSIRTPPCHLTLAGETRKGRRRQHKHGHLLGAT